MKFEIKSCRTCKSNHATYTPGYNNCVLKTGKLWKIEHIPNRVPSDCPLRKHEVKEVKKK